MVDKVRSLKIENPAEGGTQTDMMPTEMNPNQDYAAVKGISFLSNDNYLIDTDGSNNIQFKDATETSAITVRQLRTASFNIFDNSTNGFSATNVQTAIEETLRIITTPLTDQTYYVTKKGNDTTGNGSFGKPFLTIAKALTTITDSSPTKRYLINVGPGNYAENLVLKANIFIKGDTPLTTRITGTTININDTTWNVTSADNRSGFQDISINNTATWDFTSQINNTDGKLFFWNIRTGSTWSITANNAVNQLIIQDSQLFGTTTFTGMNSYISATTWQSGNLIVNSSAIAGVGATMSVIGGRIIGNITATWTANLAVTLNLAALAIGPTTILTASGASCTVNVNDASLPVPANRSFVSSAILNRVNDNFAGGLLSSTTNIIVSAATAPLASQSLTATSTTNATWQYPNGVGTSFYGDGSDGNLSISSGTTTLSRTMYYNDLTISGTASIDANGYKIYVKGTLTNSITSGIKRIPNNGTNGAGQTNGNGGTALTENDVGQGLAGQAGANGGGSSSSGVPGNNAGTTEGYGGAGGSSGSAGSSGTAGTAGVYTNVPERVIRHDHVYKLDYKNGGQGGAGGAGGAASLLANGGGGGGGGSGGGVLIIFANILNNTGSFSCIGGNGGNGGNAPSGNSRGGGGGGGGGGGHIFIACNTATSTGTLTVTAGSAGNGGNGAGSGAAGAAGSSGSIGHTTVFTASTNTWTVT